MDIYNLISHVEISDIPETYQPVVSLIGVDNFLKLCRYASGDQLYFPMLKSILKNARNRLILQEYNGYNLKELSRKYALTVRAVKNIVHGYKPPLNGIELRTNPSRVEREDPRV